MLAGCGSETGTADPGNAGAGTQPQVSPSPADRLAEAQAGAEAEIARLTWPDRYRLTVEGLTPKLGDPEEFPMTEEHGADLASIWNLCAWLREGVDRIGAGASAEQLDDAADHIDQWASGEPDGAYYEEFSGGIRMGDPTAANEYIAANDCSNFPS